MTKRNTIKRLVRARMQKTGESYAAALRNVRRPDPGAELLAGDWPDWTSNHPWLRSLLSAAEAANPQPGRYFTHFHLLVAYMAEPAVSRWLAVCGAPMNWRQECEWMLNLILERNSGRAEPPASNPDPGDPDPGDPGPGDPGPGRPHSGRSTPVIVEAADMLDMARAEAATTGRQIDATSFLPAAVDWIPCRLRPCAAAMRVVASGGGGTPPLDVDWRTWRIALAIEHGKPEATYGPKTRYSYRTEGPGPLERASRAGGS